MKNRLTFVMSLLLPALLVSCKTEMPPETEQVQSSIIETSEKTSATTETTTIEETKDESSIVHEYDELPIEITEDILSEFSEQYIDYTGYFAQFASVSYEFLFIPILVKNMYIISR